MIAGKLIKLQPAHKLGIAAGYVAVGIALSLLPVTDLLFEGLENRALDYRFISQGGRSTADLPIWIVLVDDDAVAEYGFRSPTPRMLIADLVDVLNAKGVQCIGLDYIFDRPHRPPDDARLEQALARSAVPVVLVDQAIERFARHAVPAYSEVRSDSRNVVRIYPFAREGEDLDQSFAGALYSACFGQPPELPAGIEPEHAHLNFYGPPSRLTDTAPTFPVVSARDVAALPEAVLRGKIVLVGSGMEDLGDTFLTPFSTADLDFRLTFGVELHAAALGMLAQGAFLHSVPAGPLIAGMAALYLIVALSAMFLPIRVTLAVGGIATVSWLALSGGLFLGWGLLLPVVVPIFFSAMVFVLCQSTLYFTEARYARFLRSTFSRYISPEVLREMVDHGWGLDLGGESRRLTIFFSDLEGFTSFSERLTPTELVALLNEYLGAMTEHLFETRGTIGAFIGDAIMAYYGAPADLPDHAERTCRAALRMQKTLAELNVGWEARGLPRLRMRIGIHTGEVVLGNIGSEKRQDFTIIGDSVNLAARLEGVNKYYGTWIIASGATLDETPGAFRTRELGRIIVKGRTAPVPIHEVVGFSDDPPLSAKLSDLHRRYAEALAKFYAGDLGGAERLFGDNGDAHDDAASRFMAVQCREMAGRDPGAEWNGTVTLTSK